jgi:hypothetical protein
MVPVRDLLMSTIIAMNVPTVMASTDMLWRAVSGIRRTDLENMLIHMIPMDMMQMSIVEVISVSGMVNGQVPTPGSMLVFVILMLLAATHMDPPP